MTRAPKRYTTRPLPPYTFIPGCRPHPRRSPEGHAFGRPEPAPAPVDRAAWEESETWLFAADLYNHGFYWESHEQWEALWHAHGRRGPVAALLKGLIQTAAAHVKTAQARWRGVDILAAKSAQLIEDARAELGTEGLGLDLSAFLVAHRAWFGHVLRFESPGPAEAFPFVSLARRTGAAT